MYNFIMLLMTKEVIQPKMIVMIFPEIDEIDGIDAGFPVNTQHMYILFIFELGCVST